MLIDYQNVNIYQGEELILKDVNFDIDEGQFVYIIGKVGSGKSSLLKTLYCELDLYPDEVGKAEVLGRKVYMKGDIVESYYGIPGIKNITDFVIQ